MHIDINEISFNELNIESNYLVIELIKQRAENREVVTDEIFSWIINPPPIYAAEKSDELNDIMKRHAIQYENKKKESIKIVKLIKKEFYDFFCTQSEKYAKERDGLIGKNINTLITGFSAAVATKVYNIEVGVITSIITAFIITMCKIGKNVTCEFFRPEIE